MTTDDALIVRIAFVRLTRAAVCILIGLLVAYVLG
jgi:hypothetical protein